MLKKINKTAMIFDEREISYSELISNSLQWAKNHTLEHGDRVVIYAENSIEWVFAFYSVWAQGAIAVPFDCMAPMEDLAYVLKDCAPKTIWTSKKCEAAARNAVTKSGVEIEILILEDESSEIVVSDEDCVYPDFVENDLALLIYTSGTTGSPKGVMLTYSNIIANIKGVFDAGYFQPSDRIMVLLPTHHILPLMGTIIAPLYTGGTIAFAPSLQGEDIIATLQKNKITMMIGVPRLYDVIAKGIMAKINASLIKRLIYKLCRQVGSKKLSKKIFKQVHDRFGGNIKSLISGGAAIKEHTADVFLTLGFDLASGYGMSETSPIITFPRPGTWRLNSSGQALPGVEVEIRDDEICARGVNVMRGYWNRPEETAHVLKDGWIYTGDVGHFDEDGFLYVTGRKKEIIVLPNGKNINPEEIESKLLSKFPIISEVAVFLDDDLLQCLIVPDLQRAKIDGVLNINEYLKWDVIAKYNSECANYKKLNKFTITKEELPKTRLGKIRRFALPEAAKKVNPEIRANKNEDFVEYEEYVVIKEFIEEKVDRQVYPDDHLEIDLALDSLDKVSLQVFLNDNYGVEISEDKLMEYSSIATLAAYVKEAKIKSENIVNSNMDWHKILNETISAKEMPKSWFTQSFFRWLGKVFLKTFFNFKAKGWENIPNTPCIITPNHQSFFDGLIVASAMKKKQFKKSCFFAKAKHVKNNIVNFLAERNNIIVSDINKDLKLSIQKIAEALRNNKNVIIFPEGTRTRDGNIGKFKDMFAIISKELNVPIVPVMIDGAYEALPHGSKFPKFGQEITINILPSITQSDLSYSELCLKVQETINCALNNSRNK